MASKNRTIRSFINLVPDYSRSKCERHETGIHRCIQVICCMENFSVFDTSQPEIIEFFINVRELLKNCDHRSSLGWRTIELIRHLGSDPTICEFIQKLEFVPILASYLHPQLESEKAVLILSVLELLTDGIIVERSGFWLSSLLKYLTDTLLEKSDTVLPHLLAVLSNFCLENYVVINELQRESTCDEVLQYLMQLQATDPLVQLHAAQVVFSLLAVGSINESLLGNYITTVIELLLMGARTNNVNLIQRCGSIIMWMSRDRIIVEMIHSTRFQDLLQKSLESLVESLAESKHAGTANSILTFLVKILRTNFIANKKFTETFIPSLTGLLNNSKIANGLLELLTDLVKSSSALNLMDQPGSEEILEQLVNEAVRLVNNFQNGGQKSDSCKTLEYALQILQKLYKFSPLNGHITSALKADTFVGIVSTLVPIGDVHDKKKDPPEALIFSGRHIASIVVEILTLLGQIACKVSLGRSDRDKVLRLSEMFLKYLRNLFDDLGGEWLQSYSFLLGQGHVQQCLAKAILHGDCHLKQTTLALVGTLGFSSDSVAGLSQALNQMCCLSSEQRCGGIGGVINTEAAEPAANRPQSNWSLPPIQSHKIDKLIVKMQNQDKFWETMKKCDVLELMELQMERREREEHRLKLDLDSIQDEMNALRISRLQIQAENSRMMAMLLGKSELVEHKESENRGLTRRLEQMQQLLSEAETSWNKERAEMKREREKLKNAHEEMTNQYQTQFDTLKKQNRTLLQRLEETQEELQEVTKTGESFKLLVGKHEKEIEKLQQELLENHATTEGLRFSLKKKDKEGEEKDKEISSLKQTSRKSEMMCHDLEIRLVESEKACEETREKLAKLEKIREFIYELSSGKKKLFEE